MSTARALVLALALEAAEINGRPTHFRKRKSAYYATMLIRPEEYELLGLVDGPDGIDLLWRPVAPGSRPGRACEGAMRPGPTG